jgi:hypothetical protein
MFDNLRQKSAEEAEFLRQEEASSEPPPAPTPSPRRRVVRRRGLTPVQRFVLALMLFLNVSVLGCFALIVFERIVLPVF